MPDLSPVIIWCKANTAFYNKNVIPAVKQGGGSVIVWGWFASSGPVQLAIKCLNHEFCLRQENPKGECLVISPWPQAQLGYAERQWSEAQEQVYLWMTQKKQSEDFRMIRVLFWTPLRCRDRTLNGQFMLRSPQSDVKDGSPVIRSLLLLMQLSLIGAVTFSHGCCQCCITLFLQ